MNFAEFLKAANELAERRPDLLQEDVFVYDGDEPLDIDDIFDHPYNMDAEHICISLSKDVEG